MREHTRFIWFPLSAVVFLSGCDVAFPIEDQGEPAVSHDKEGNAFDLIGVHADAPCASCHASGSFEPLFDPEDANDCVACHQSEYDGQHPDSMYPTECSICHTPTEWSAGSFNHNSISGGFELLGTHASRACTACHDPDTFEPLYDPIDANDCVTCHQSDYDGEHSGSGYPTDCSTCHTPTVWSDGSFDHTSNSGGFELLGTHARKACTACHDETTFVPLFNPGDANDCVTCHRAYYDLWHRGGGWPTTCASCHTTTTWAGATFSHVTVSGGFELLGTHASKACTACHDATTFAPIYDPVDANDCVTCHQSDYDDEHSGSGYPTDCSTCHTPTEWSDGSFDHAAASGGFELWGAHVNRPCTVCHDAATFDPLFQPADDRDCETCHQ